MPELNHSARDTFFEGKVSSYIEGGIHGWIHGATAAAFNETVVGTFHSPLSSYFYGIHGLVDGWWRHWDATQKRPLKEVIDTKIRIKEHKEFIKEHKELVFEKLQPEKFQKEKDKDKDIFEGGFPGGGGDPAPWPLSELERRLADVETLVSRQAFIQPQERPAVGAAAREEKKKE